jgi:hypothetical protein
MLGGKTVSQLPKSFSVVLASGLTMPIFNKRMMASFI